MIVALHTRSASARKDRDWRGRRVRAQAKLAILAGIVSILLWPWAAADARGNVAATDHNLSPSGKGTQKDGRAGGTCVYCHAPHNAVPSSPLWNRPSSGVTYQLYSSASMQASVDQPTGSSRLCLSCHDGILALSSARLVGPGHSGTATAQPMTGKNVIGTDLRASHPISFTYDTALAAKVGELVEPNLLPSTVRLDSTGQLQCTSCHDPHEDTLPNFLRMDNSQGALCTTCHRLPLWSSSSHATSTATWNGSGTNPWPPGGNPSVAANGCNNCHRSHGAGHGEWLLARADEPENCTICHSGTVAKKNIGAEFAASGKVSRHPIDAAQWTHAPNENSASMPRHVTCVDCHDPHQAKAATAADKAVPGPLQGVAGLSATGTRIASASSEYQVCLKCHGESSMPGPIRVDRSRNIGDKLSTGSTSYHPIVTAARNASARGLVKGYLATSVIGCIDCHNNSDGTPRGPHASRYAPILERNYVATDPSVESPATYAICYKCHDRDNLLSAPAAAPATPTAPRPRSALLPPRIGAQRGSGFPHWLHVVKNQTSCAVCHDAHGSRKNAHLIDFMARDATGNPVVSANSTGRLDYAVTGQGQGTCSLKCHGRDHSALGY